MYPEFDVIVVGAGTAGIPAALGAVERGLKVALVEAAADIGGTLHLSSASISAGGTDLQRRAGIADSAQDHFIDALRINHGTGDHVLLRKWTEEAGPMVDWLESIGWTCMDGVPHFAPEHDLYNVERTYRSTNAGIEVLDAFRRELARVEPSGLLTLMLETRFTDLVTRNGRVTGILADTPLGPMSLSAQSVILTTGGFSGSARHWQELHGHVPLRYHVETVRGDALDPVRAAGGSVWFTEYCLPAFGGTRTLDSKASAWIHSDVLPTRRPPWEIYVNERGERFMPEDEMSIDARERAVMAQPNWAFWIVWDEAIRKASKPLFRWPAETVEALFAGEGGEDFVVAGSVEELAERTGMPEGALRTTIQLYNRGQAVGSDMFRRKHMPAPIAEAPFYAVRHYGCSISCYPGIKVDEDLRVVRADGSPIEGLYAAGEVIGIGFLGHGFLSGSIVSSAITFGRKLGREVPAKVPA